MALSAKNLPNYTYQDYCKWEGRWEIIEGIPFARSPMASPKHQRIAVKLSIQLELALNNNNCNCQVYQPIDLKINENTVVNPDLLIVCRPIEAQYLDTPPELVVEILSPSTEQKDRHTKFDLYRNFGIKYYLLVGPKNEEIELYELADGAEYRKKSSEDLIRLKEGCDIHVSYIGIWA